MREFIVSTIQVWGPALGVLVGAALLCMVVGGEFAKLLPPKNKE